MRDTTKRNKKVENLLYTKFRGNAATRYGSGMEDKTIEEYVSYQQMHGHPNIKVHRYGLFIPVHDPWLAGTPDGVVDDLDDDTSQSLGLVEIKNPYTARDQTLLEAAQKSTFCLKLDKDNQSLGLKHGHDYYHQIQAQLYCSGRQWCDFVVRTDKDLHIERIYRDQSWPDKNLHKLKNFYFSALLPELACPRHHNGGIREPV